MCISARPNYFQAFSVAKLSTFLQTQKPVFMFPQKKSTWMPTSALHNQKLNTWNCNRLNKCGLDYSGQHVCQSSNNSSVSDKNSSEKQIVFNGNPPKKGAKVWPAGRRNTAERQSDHQHQYLDAYCFCQWTENMNNRICLRIYNTIRNKYTLRPQWGRDTALTIYIKSRYQLRPTLIKRCSLKIQWL